MSVKTPVAKAEVKAVKQERRWKTFSKLHEVEAEADAEAEPNPGSLGDHPVDSGTVPKKGPKDDDVRAIMRKKLLRERVFRQRLNGQRVVFTPEEQPTIEQHADPEIRHPLRHHDVLVVAPEGVHDREEYYRIPVRKLEDAGIQAGVYDQPPELMDPYDIGQRKVNSFSQPQDWGDHQRREQERGPAFATLPVKPEPGASTCVVCYLIDTRNLNYQNAWTAEEWADPGGRDELAAAGASNEEFEALLAGPRGQVFRLKIANSKAWAPGSKIQFEGERGEVECVELGSQMEVWNQLRSGCVAGRALYDDEKATRVIPLVNITTLTPVNKKVGGS